MSREAPPGLFEGEPVPSLPDAGGGGARGAGLEPPEGARFSVMWLGLPFAALLLPLALRVLVRGVRRGVRLDAAPDAIGIFALFSLGAAGLTTAWVAARRSGIRLSGTLVAIPAAIPWLLVVAINATAESRGIGPGRALSFARGIQSSRTLGAGLFAALVASAAIVLLLEMRGSRRRGALWAWIALPAWGFALAWPAALTPTQLVTAFVVTGGAAYVGIRAEGRDQALDGVTAIGLLAAAFYASAVALHTDILGGVGLRGARTEFFDAYLSRSLPLMPIAPAAGALFIVVGGLCFGGRRLRFSTLASVALLGAIVAALSTIDGFAADLAIARPLPDVWPPWVETNIDPIPIPRDESPPNPSETLVLSPGQVRRLGSPAVRLDDAGALRDLLVTVADPGQLRGERMHIVALPPVEPQRCFGRAVGLWVDRSVSGADLRRFVDGAATAGVAVLVLRGPREADPVVATTGYRPWDVGRVQVGQARIRIHSPCTRVWLDEIEASEAEQPLSALVLEDSAVAPEIVERSLRRSPTVWQTPSLLERLAAD